MRKKLLCILPVFLIFAGCTKNNSSDTQTPTDKSTEFSQSKQTNDIYDYSLFSFELPEGTRYVGTDDENGCSGGALRFVSEDYRIKYENYIKDYWGLENVEDYEDYEEDPILQNKEITWFNISNKDNEYVYYTYDSHDPYQVATAMYNDYLNSGYIADTEVRYSELTIDGITAYEVEIYPDLTFPSEKNHGMPGFSQGHIFMTAPNGKTIYLNIYFYDEETYKDTEYFLNSFHFK